MIYSISCLEWLSFPFSPVIQLLSNTTNNIFHNLQAAEEKSKEAEPEDTESVQTASTPTPSETTEPQSPDRLSTVSSNLENPATDSVVENYESKSANTDSGRTEEESNRTDDMDEGVDLQGKNPINVKVNV